MGHRGAVVVLACGLLAPAGSEAGFTVLHSHLTAPAAPFSLISDGAGNLYGTTIGSLGQVIFTVRTDGGGFTVLHSFLGENVVLSARCVAVDEAGNLFGTLQSGSAGAIFTVKTDGSGYHLIHEFSWRTCLAYSAGTLYGSAHGEGIFAMAPDGTILRTISAAVDASVLTLDDQGNLFGSGYVGETETVFTLRTDGTGFTTLHMFPWPSPDGNDICALVLDGQGNLFGAASSGGSSNRGVVFEMGSDGTGFTVLHSFTGAPGDVAVPLAIVLDGTGGVYGVAQTGGSADGGALFFVRSDGSGYAIRHQFAGGPADGESPMGGLVLDPAGYVYGVTRAGGPSDGGFVFRLALDGTGFTAVHTFVGDDGVHPDAPLSLSGDGTLFGTTSSGGVGGLGTIFRMNVDGSGYAVIHSFDGAGGSTPHSGVVLDAAGNLYGATSSGGGSDNGLVFTVAADGTGYRVLHEFSGTDGSSPSRPLLEGGRLFGLTDSGGAHSAGVAYAMDVEGTNFEVLHDFASGIPVGPMVLDADGNLYGACRSGAGGTVFTLRTDGTAYAVLRELADSPYGSVVLDGSGYLYGTTATCSGNTGGAVFKLATDGSAFEVLHSFPHDDVNFAGPRAPLALDAADNLYGTVETGGAGGGGLLFTLKTDGTAYRELHEFGGEGGVFPGAGVVLDASDNLYGTTLGGGPPDSGTEYRIDGLSASSPTRFFTLAPCRVIDTRRAAGPRGAPALAGQSVRTFSIAGACGIPPGAASLSGNLVAVDPASVGDLRVFRGDLPAPLASQLNFRPGQVRASGGIFAVSPGSQLLSIQNDGSGRVDVVLDVSGYFE